MGTPEFAVPALQVLLAAPAYQVVGVVTQPDRPAGRGRLLQPSPVKQIALQAGLPVVQPEHRLDKTDALDQLRAWEPDFLVVVAFGQILRPVVLDLPRRMPINVHASMLPRWRGAAPIQAAIRAGDLYTGVTTMQMDAGLDTGPILLQDSIPILPDETGQSLHDKLSLLGARLLLHTLDWLLSESIRPHPQPESPDLVTYAPVLKKEDGAIDWSHSAEQIDRQVRAFYPWPGTYTHWEGRRVKIIAGRPFQAQLDGAPGQVRTLARTAWADAGPLAIVTGAGLYIPTRLQLEGRAAQDAAAFLNGAPDFATAVLS